MQYIFTLFFTFNFIGIFIQQRKINNVILKYFLLKVDITLQS